MADFVQIARCLSRFKGNIHVNITINTSLAQPAETGQELSREPDSGKRLFCRITERAYQDGRAQSVEEELRRACINSPKLTQSIRTNEALGYLNTQNLSSKELYLMLNEHFHLPFGLHTFTVYRSKFY